MFGNLQLDSKKIYIILFVFVLPIISVNMQRKDGILSDFIYGIDLVIGVTQKGYSKFSSGIKDTIECMLILLI